tara:strand:- start:62 stop:370 length:309 start_codon:yes stop_codon:yes gene_type:complete
MNLDHISKYSTIIESIFGGLLIETLCEDDGIFLPIHIPVTHPIIKHSVKEIRFAPDPYSRVILVTTETNKVYMFFHHVYIIPTQKRFVKEKIPRKKIIFGGT